MPFSGFLFCDKPAGITSRGVDNALQKRFSTRRVGHLGTLDPFATGLLIVAVGSATKCLPFLQDEEKTYEASLLLGQSTSTGDPEGEVTGTQDVPNLREEQVKEVLSSFLGESYQLPPMTSAIKFHGEALYKAARRGENVERAKRKIKVSSIELLSFAPPRIAFRVTVSKGTYIRVLGEDIATRLGTLGHLESLRRLAVGPFSVEEARPLEQISQRDFHDPFELLSYLPSLELDEAMLKKVQNGVALSLSFSAERLLLTHQEKAIAIYQKEDDGLFHCLRGLL